MVVDFPAARKRIRKLLARQFGRQVEARSTFLSRIKCTPCFEGDVHSIAYADGTKQSQPFLRFQSDIAEVGCDPTSQTRDRLTASIESAAREMAGDFDREVLNLTRDHATAAGNVVTGDKANMADSVLRTLDQIHIEFEDGERDKPIFPTISMHPCDYARYEEQFRALDETQRAAYLRRLEQLLDDKHRQHLLDLESRRLLD